MALGTLIRACACAHLRKSRHWKDERSKMAAASACGSGRGRGELTTYFLHNTGSYMYVIFSEGLMSTNILNL